MDEADKEAYLMALKQLEARKQLQMFKVQDYSQMKSDARQNTWKEVHKEAYPAFKPKVIKMDEIDSILGGL